MKKLIDFATSLKVILALIASCIAAMAWAVDYLHKPFVKRTDLINIFIKRDINMHQVNITKLEIRKGLSTTKIKENEFNMLIGIEKVQILRLKGEKHGSN